jgi:hypothetical protein
MKNSRKLLVLFLFLGTAVVACSDDDDDVPRVTDTRYNYDVTLSGANEVPANTSTATGKFVGSYVKSTKVLSFTLTYSGLVATDWHIHKGTPDVSGPVEIGLGPIVPSPLTSTLTLTAAQETDLLAGNFYVNVHSATFPEGEIRAQLAAPVVEETDDPDGY